jgi:hypothetical protein
MKRQRDFRNLQVSLLSLVLFVFVTGEVMSEEAAIEESNKVIEVMGLFCSGVEYYEDGTLEFCVLAREGAVSGQVLAARTGVHFTKEGVLDWCTIGATRGG